MITACCNCHKVLNEAGVWIEADIDPATPNISHGICPECTRKLYPELADDLLKK